MASFNTISLGNVVSMRTAPNPAALKHIAYPGVRGIGVTYEGSRGMRTEACGLSYAASLAELAATEQAFRNCVNLAVLAQLVDTCGVTWNNVILTHFQPEGDICVFTGGVAREYRMEFLHLSET